MDMNNVSLTGRLGADPELRSTKGGTPVANLRVAVQGFKDDETIWLNATAWNGTAEVAARYLAKGSRVAITGRLNPLREFTRRDGTTGASLEVTVRDLAFLDSKEDAPKRETPAQAPAEPAPAAPDPDDIPF